MYAVHHFGTDPLSLNYFFVRTAALLYQVPGSIFGYSLLVYENVFSSYFIQR